MPDVKMKLEGVKDLMNAFNELPKRTGKSVIRRVLKNAAEPVVRDAKQFAMDIREDGTLIEGIAIGSRLSKSQRKGRTKQGDVELFIGPGEQSPLAHLFEFGTADRYTESGAFRGRMQPQPFMRPAWEKNKRLVLRKFSNEFGIEIEKAAKRIARKQARLLAKARAEGGG